jgi:hypothetical protein
MKYAIDVVLCVMAYIPNFIKFGSGIQKLMREGIHRHTNLFIFDKNKESRLIKQRSFPSTFFPIYYLLISLPFDAT